MGFEEPFHPRFVILYAYTILGRSLSKVAVMSLHKRLFCFPLSQTFSASCLSLRSHKDCVAINEESAA